jgi:hypothetical protein
MTVYNGMEIYEICDVTCPAIPPRGSMKAWAARSSVSSNMLVRECVARYMIQSAALSTELIMSLVRDIRPADGDRAT